MKAFMLYIKSNSCNSAFIDCLFTNTFFLESEQAIYLNMRDQRCCDNQTSFDLQTKQKGTFMSSAKPKWDEITGFQLLKS